MSASAAVVDEHVEVAERWPAEIPHVRRALAFIQKGGIHGRTPEELVEWDATHGRRLFNWDDAEAAEFYRLTQARRFMNRFRFMFERKRVRAFINVRKNKRKGIARSGYRTVEVVAAHASMRDQIVQDIIRRMESLAAELRMWQLSYREQTALFKRLRIKMHNNEQAVDRRRYRAS